MTLVERLRGFDSRDMDPWALLEEAADRIEALEQEGGRLETMCQSQADFICDQGRRIEALEAALREIALLPCFNDTARTANRIARRALEGK